MQTPKFNIGDVVIYKCDMYTELFTIDRVKIWKDGSIVYFSWQNIQYTEEELEFYLLLINNE